MLFPSSGRIPHVQRTVTPVEKSPRILIARLSAIGDCILTMPLLCALRAHFPDAHLAWVTEPGPASLLAGHRCLDELLVVRKGWLKSPRDVWQLRRRLRARKFDVTLDPQSLTKSAAVAWLSGARRRIGFAAPRGRELSVWLNNELQPPAARYLVDCQWDLLRALGVAATPVTFAVPVDAAATHHVAAWLSSELAADTFALLHPGASWASKRWCPERFATVAAFLGARCSLRSLVAWAGDQERARAQQIVAESGGHAVLAPSTSLPELAAFLRRATLFVGSDSGPMHLSAAVGTPCVALFGPTRPEDCGPYGAGHVTVQEYYQTGTTRQRRQAANDALRAISAAQVCAACEQVLARTAGTARADHAA